MIEYNTVFGNTYFINTTSPVNRVTKLLSPENLGAFTTSKYVNDNPTAISTGKRMNAKKRIAYGNNNTAPWNASVSTRRLWLFLNSIPSG